MKDYLKAIGAGVLMALCAVLLSLLVDPYFLPAGIIGGIIAGVISYVGMRDAQRKEEQHGRTI